MSVILVATCVECREAISVGDIYLDETPPPIWRIHFFGDTASRELEYFLLAHRGHVLGLIDDFERDRVGDVGPSLESTWSLDELREKHPVDLDEVEELAPASPLLRSLLEPNR